MKKCEGKMYNEEEMKRYEGKMKNYVGKMEKYVPPYTGRKT